MNEIKRCKKCNDILSASSSDYKNVDGLCYVCWTERDEAVRKNIK